MRVLFEHLDPRLKVSVFAFNEKWILKTEVGLCEQTFKVPQMDCDFEQIKKICMSDAFLKNATARFASMHEDWAQILSSAE
jgi:hypothetical protein